MDELSVGLVIRSVSDADTVELGRQAESNGYDSIWINEGLIRDPFVTLTELACHTDRIGLGTDIVNVFARTPANLAVQAATLSRVSNGRFRLGVGTGHAELIETVHDVEYHRPVSRLRETVEIVTRTTRQEGPVQYSGEIFDVSFPVASEEEFPVYNAALSPMNLGVTGAVCDGWLPHCIPFSKLSERFELIAEAATEAGREPDDIAVAPLIPAAVHEEANAAYDAIRQNIVHYATRYENYRDVLREMYPDTIEPIVRSWEAGDLEENVDDALSRIPVRVVKDLGIAGTPEEAREQLQEVVEKTIVNTPILIGPRTVFDETGGRTRTTTSTIETAMEELAPSKIR